MIYRLKPSIGSFSLEISWPSSHNGLRLGLLPLKPVASFSDLDIQYEYGHVFVAGRYNKYSRSLSQTAWIIDGVRRGESSVEELITQQVLDLYQADGTWTK